MKIKNTILLLVLCSFFISCSDKKEENKENQKIVQKPGKIEIVQNENAYNKKVNISNDIKDRSYYYSYNKNNEEKNKRTKLDAHVRVKSPYESVQISLLVGSLSKEFIVKCSACHNDYANGIIGPSLLKKDKNSIRDSIMSFKKDPKKNVLMSDLVKNMSEKQILDIASEIANFNKKIRELKAK